MKQAEKRQTELPLLWERVFIAVLVIAYLFAFSRTVPHGDALRVVRQIQAEHLIWNPNHLIFDPIGYGWYALLEKFGFSISALDSFEIISGIATVASLLVFHAILVQAGVKWWGARALAIGGLFASRSFLSLANNQYYFMVQMPLLLGALYLGMRFLAMESDEKSRAMYLYGIGVLVAVAATILFSNVLLVVALGLVVGFTRNRQQASQAGWNYAYAARIWGAAALVGFPAYIFGYLASGSSAGFFHWLLSYQGESASALNDLYLVQWSTQSVVESLARLGFNLFSASILENAGLGTYFRALIFREPLEFVPEIFRLSLVVALTPIIIGMMLMLMVWAVRRFRRDMLIPFAFAWGASYLLFNFLWSVGGEHFWVQILPVVWLMWMVYLFSNNAEPFKADIAIWSRKNWKLWATLLVVPALLFVNTVNTVIPVSGKAEAEVLKYHALLRDGDLEIMPGWEVIGWMRSEQQRPRVERLLLMNMALQSKEQDRHIQRLPEIVADHLASGRRVVVGRLYDKDHEINPWYGLTRLGWPRSRIQSLLGRYCHTEIGRVDDVVFREIKVCRSDG